jgi:long-chain acyl-CoA synthetase
MVIGEKCKNVYALVNVNKDAVKGLPDDEVRAKVKADVQELSKHLAAYQKPKDVLVLPDFSIDEGTLTATLKVRRHKINEIHKDKIEEFLKSNGEEIATKREVEIASSKILESLADATLGNNN